MRILWLSHVVPYPPKSGVLQRSHQLVTGLAAAHELDLLAFHQRGLLAPMGAPARLLEEARTALGRCCRHVAFFDAPVDRHRFARHRIALASLLGGAPYTLRWLDDAGMAAAVAQRCRAVRYDAVVFDTISLLPYRRAVPRAALQLLDHHNIESHMMRRRAPHTRNPMLRAYFAQEGRRLERIERETCPTFDLNLTCSAVDAERLAAIAPGSEIAVVPNAVDLEHFAPRPEVAQEPRLIFVGTLGWYPNVEAVLLLGREIWPRLRDAVPGLEVDVIGAQPPPALRALAAADPRFHVHGFVDDVRPAMARAAVYVCPIRDGGGTKLKILDALAMGMAIVAHPVACEGIDVTPGRDVLLAEDAAGFADAIRALLRDPARRRALGAAARRLAETRYGARAVCASLASAIESRLAARAARTRAHAAAVGAPG